MLIAILFGIFIPISLASCPAGSIQGSNADDCYQIFAQPTNWVAAEETCVRYGGHLASISNIFQNAFLLTEVQSLLINADGAWIGGNNIIVTGNWSWSDNSSFNFTNWQKGQPTGNQGLCASINRVDGSWSSQNCLSLNLPYICKINGTSDSCISTCPTSVSLTCPTSTSITCPSCSPCTTPFYNPCPVSYLYYQETKFCYKGYNMSITFDAAEAMCNNDGGHLASIHSYSESIFIGTQFGNFTHYSWIGLQLQNGQWTWTDGTPTDYLYWAPGYPSGNNNCTEIILEHLSTYYLYFENFDCNYLFTFICKRSAL